MKYIFCYSVIKSSGGEYFYSIIEGLINRGHKVLIINDRADVDNNAFNMLKSIGVDIYKWPSKRPTKFDDFKFLYNLIKIESPNVIVSTFGAVNVATIVGFIMGVRKRIAFIRTDHNYINTNNEKNRVKLWIKRIRKNLVYKLATHIFTNSEFMINDILKHTWCKREKITKVQYLIPEKEIVSSEPRTKGQICFCGSLTKVKGQEDLINALSAIRNRNNNIKVVFLGDGPERQSLIEKAIKLDVIDLCEFKGSVPSEEVKTYFRKSWISVTASRSEAFGWVNLESISLGTPVISTCVGGISEIIEDNVNGLKFDIGNHEKLANIILMLYEDDVLYDKLSNGAKNVFKNKFSLENNIDKQILLFE